MSTHKEIPKEIPVEISSAFNWGAFFWSSFWAIRFGVWKVVFICIGFFLATLPLTFINPWLFPLGVLVPSVYVGFKGNTWSWEKGHFNSVEAFVRSQRLWKWFGLIFYGIMAAIFAILLIT